MDRLQLNAALDELIESKGFSEGARQMVYEFGLSLAPLARFAGSVQMQGSGDGIMGHTQEHGNVKIENDRDEVKNIEFGGEPARIGSFKVSREKERGDKFSITIAHFWKNDLGTESLAEETQAWRLACDKNGPVWFGERATQVAFDHFGIRLKRHVIVETWGTSPDKRHHAGWALEVSIGMG